MRMKKHFSLLFAFVMVISTLLSACSGNNSGETPEQSLTNALIAIKDLDEEGLKNYYFDSEELFSSIGEVLGVKDSVKLIFGNLSYNILSSSISGKTATVKAEITNTDMAAAFDEFFDRMLALAFSEDADDRTAEEEAKEIEQILVDTINESVGQTKTAVLDIKLKKNGDIWVLDESDEFDDAITGGLFSAAEDILNTGETE